MSKSLSGASICNQVNFRHQHTYVNLPSDILSIKPLPLNFVVQLRRQDDFYICSSFTDDFVGPPTIILQGKTYYRFMKFIYLPQPPEKLHIEQVIKVCDLRLDYLGQLVDVKFNDFAIETMVDHIRSTFTSTNACLKVLDFGCGSGLSSQLLLNYLPNSDMMGIDVSKKAVHYCQEQGFSAIHSSHGKQLPFETASFDLIFAAFVMHFDIDTLALAELGRVLRPQGKFVFNVYQRSIDKVVQKLHRAGFYSFEVWNNVYRTGINYGIISCGISSL